MLNPCQYEMDMVKLTGKMLDHDPWPNVDEDLFFRHKNRCRDMWKEEFDQPEWTYDCGANTDNSIYNWELCYLRMSPGDV